jgi:two-component system nitrogen regulation response regulator GlnG/two-component system response regulator HydG
MTGLVVLWSRDEPHRIGEAVLLRARDPNSYVFGRGTTDAQARQLGLVRHRPNAIFPTGPLNCPRISRAQLQLALGPGDSLLVENLGSCPLEYRGQSVQAARVTAGEMLSLRNELLLLCIRRDWMPRMALDRPGGIHPFGGPDPWGMVGESVPMWDLRQRIVAIANQAHHVLILGESGSGKELVAQAIHAHSARAKRRIVSRNAATIPEGLAAAELFGNIRNYPNQGSPERSGLVGEAQSSTLFLDEFAELPQAAQAQLLRVMDNGEYQRLGESTTRQSDLRILAATNRPIMDIKHDVLPRFKIHLAVPGLNQRREDIPLLIAHLLRRHASGGSKAALHFFPNADCQQMPRVSPLLVEALASRHYATHTRELETLLVRACLEGNGRYLELPREALRDLPIELAHELPRSGSTLPPLGPAPGVAGGLTLEEHARLMLLRQHRFSPTACGNDPAYPGNRQTADLHLRQLFCKTLKFANWNMQGSVTLLAGESDRELIEKASARLSTFVSNLYLRVAGKSNDDLPQLLAKEWKGSTDIATELILAMRAEKLGPLATATRLP